MQYGIYIKSSRIYEDTPFKVEYLKRVKYVGIKTFRTEDVELPFTKLYTQKELLDRGFIDTIKFCLPRIYVNEHTLQSLNLSPLFCSFTVQGQYMHLGFQREYIPTNISVFQYLRISLRYLCEAGVLHIPVWYTRCTIELDGSLTTTEEDIPNEVSDIDSVDGFVDYLLTHRKLSIDIAFDCKAKSLPKHLKGFTQFKNTWYSNDYHVYANRTRKKSSVKVYAKAIQLESKKHMVLEHNFNRIEFTVDVTKLCNSEDLTIYALLKGDISQVLYKCKDYCMSLLPRIGIDKKQLLGIGKCNALASFLGIVKHSIVDIKQYIRNITHTFVQLRDFPTFIIGCFLLLSSPPLHSLIGMLGVYVVLTSVVQFVQLRDFSSSPDKISDSMYISDNTS